MGLHWTLHCRWADEGGSVRVGGIPHTLTGPPVADSSILNATGSHSKKWGSSRVRHPCGGD
ncbi:hypothetical protein CGRA01v4_05170 [Colletotrichum graminicola]|nr:hypothetical protein CGRA01v4_05170 [Colletotrichum graminicola]